ncbi:membrane protein insertase YidC [Dasania marina]|uniref:membrane protein insertase YidC n=1 Tax=Dasania marina TaxID=471499 RepID=UPI0030DB34DF|tara:strand:- start:19310 stop:20989 length:1680 start_codon:yes stop_codon:yes gene_type:complete
MDFKRYLLIGAIAVLSYMLLMEWSQFRAAQKTPVTNNTATINSNSNAAATPAGLIPNESSTPDDFPSATADQLTAPVVTETPSANTIEVSTDTLKVRINPLGGDINYLALAKHYAVIDSPDQPFVLLEQGQARTYIAQSGLIGKNGTDTRKGRPLFSAAQQQYQLQQGADKLVVDLQFTTDNNVTITKRFTFIRGKYVINVDYLINNGSSQTWSAGMFGQLKRDNSKDPGTDSGGMGMSPYLGAAFTLIDKPYKKVSFDDMAEAPYKDSRPGGWAALVQHYFLSAWIPDAETTNSYSTVKTADGFNLIRFTGPSVDVAPGQQATINSRFYAGPKNQYKLEEISPGLELSVDYGFLWLPAQCLFWLLTKIHALFGNWGAAIIGVTLLVKAAFFQLNAKAYTSMANMRKVQPKLLALRERYADDKAKQSQAMMKLYKDEKINPLGGCLPILVQMPVFISLYWVLMESVELRHAPFMLWINDLSAMDPYFILPLIMGVSMFIQQKLNPPPPDPMQAKVMQWMPVMFTFFFLFFPAGLVLYWVVNNVLSIAQQYVITKRIENS